MTSRLQTASSAIPATHWGTDWETVPWRRDKAQNLSAGRVSANATGSVVPRSGVHNFMRFFLLSGFGCFMETGILTSNRKVGFSKRWWSEVIGAECGNLRQNPRQNEHHTKPDLFG